MSETGTLKEILKRVELGISEMKEKHGEELRDIKEQVKKTNGRVTKLEQWKWLVMGFVACLAAIVLPLAMKVLESNL